ncbi:hypothetical protein BT69DRAFT_1048346 [Atractiella rhizophila]|nr:hypothetical protein BT69DRAFT_1048346 [Atractiella rhizophila]
MEWMPNWFGFYHYLYFLSIMPMAVLSIVCKVPPTRRNGAKALGRERVECRTPLRLD